MKNLKCKILSVSSSTNNETVKEEEKKIQKVLKTIEVFNIQAVHYSGATASDRLYIFYKGK